MRPSATGRDRGARRAGAIEPATVVHDLDAMLAAVDALRADDPTTPVLAAAAPRRRVARRAVRRRQRPRLAGGAARRRAPATAHDDGEWIAEIDHAGRVRDVLSGEPLGDPPAEVLARLGRLADRVAAAFDGPHDLEWVADAGGRLQLLRIRPVVRLPPRRRLRAVARPRAAAPPARRRWSSSRRRRRS